MRRVFFALWPDDTTRTEVSQLSERLEQPGLRKLKPTNLHVTLAFLGNVEEAVIQTLRQRARGLKSSPVTLQFDEIDYWPKPRIVCLTCQKQPSSLYQLINALNHLIQDLPVHRESRPFRAHMTLARKAQYRPDICFTPISMQAKKFALVESVSLTSGVEYRLIESWDLQG